MKFKSRNTLAVGLLAAACMFVAGGAQAAATIINTAGTVALGVNNLGQLNTNVGGVAVNTDGVPAGSPGTTGLAFKFSDGKFRDATAPGCLCEGWGVSVNNTTAGWASQDSFNNGGISNLSDLGFTSTASTATSNVALTSLSGLTVTHAFSQADNSPDALFKAVVTITNKTGATVNNVKYVRAMDWDVPLTEFNEFVTIKGTGTTTLLERSTDNGFSNVNPLVDSGSIATLPNTDFEDSGPTDHGAYFRFNFGSLADGESYTFTIFYGATASERTALAAIGSEAIELYSLGQSSGPGGAADGVPATYIFGFKGVGGVALTPTPGSLALVGLGLLGAGMVRRRRS